MYMDLRTEMVTILSKVLPQLVIDVDSYLFIWDSAKCAIIEVLKEPRYILYCSRAKMPGRIQQQLAVGKHYTSDRSNLCTVTYVSTHILPLSLVDLRYVIKNHDSGPEPREGFQQYIDYRTYIIVSEESLFLPQYMHNNICQYIIYKARTRSLPG